MRKSVLVLFVMACCLVLVAGNAIALDLGANITIWDGMGSDAEDNEVEPGCVQAQKWDLEAFFLNDTTLTMVGGFNFKEGEDDPWRWEDKKKNIRLHYDSGDIFIDVNGDAEYGSGNTGEGGGNEVVQYIFGYDYVLDLDFTDLTYTVYELIKETSTVKVYFGQNDESNPWAYNDGGSPLGFDGDIDFYENKAGLDSLDGISLWNVQGTHYAAAVDLSFLSPGTEFTAHFTYGCGNDNLMGSGATPIPEPATMLLLGTGLIGLACLGRKKFNKGTQ
ncbi:MAG: PEP-CTERM sorting domain-containing protein [Deltaproteobacteria bacterium]|nr:PEP-CTERM sorting domain-containing protein [Deltaproteobacteria bacterium]